MDGRQGMMLSEPDASSEEIEQFVAERWVRIMCDHAAEGVWHQDGSAGQLDALPLSDGLRERIRAWQNLYEREAQDDGSVPNEFFGPTGEVIARDVKRELPEWTVIYFDEVAYARVRGSENVNRNQYEYEIESPAAAPTRTI